MHILWFILYIEALMQSYHISSTELFQVQCLSNGHAIIMFFANDTMASSFFNSQSSVCRKFWKKNPALLQDALRSVDISSIRRLFDAPSRSRSNFRFRPPSWMTSLPFSEAEIAPAPWWGIKKLSQYWINILVDHHLIWYLFVNECSLSVGTLASAICFPGFVMSNQSIASCWQISIMVSNRRTTSLILWSNFSCGKPQMSYDCTILGNPRWLIIAQSWETPDLLWLHNPGKP